MSPERIRQLRSELSRIPSEKFRKRHLFPLKVKLEQALEVCELFSAMAHHDDCKVEWEAVEKFSRDLLEGLPRPLPKGPKQ